MFGDESLRSDYDVQISSDRLEQEIRAYQARNPHEPCVSEKGGHWRDEALGKRFTELAAWAERWESRTGREVNLAGFSRSGPEGPSVFQTDDWMMIKAEPADEE